mmetsp:Transcript_16950/g.37006  ORF Transcript_16950/g.37006 Transcript_16950/m.37006 type:complete len:330 (-) Transcript_16950:181-1170(-)
MAFEMPDSSTAPVVSGLLATIPQLGESKIAGTRMKKRELLWFTRYRELCEYAQKAGSCLVPQKHKENPSLGLWVKKQRAQYKLYMDNKPSSITKERIELLEQIGFEWNAVPEDWQARFEELKDFKEHHGDCLVPQLFPLNPPLGIWVNHQRTQYKLVRENKPSYLTPERIRLLEALGFEWSAVNAKWRARFMELEAHIKKYPGTIPCKKTNRSLHQWATYQRKLYQQKKWSSTSPQGPSKVSGIGLTKERETMLDSLGFPWFEDDEGNSQREVGIPSRRKTSLSVGSDDVSDSVSSLLMLQHQQAPLRESSLSVSASSCGESTDTDSDA